MYEGKKHLTDEEYAKYLEWRKRNGIRGRIRQQSVASHRNLWERKCGGTRPSRRPPTKVPQPVKRNTSFYFIGGVPHKITKISKATDEIRAIRLTDKKPMIYVYTAVRKGMQRSYSTGDVSRLLQKSSRWINNCVFEMAKKPFFCDIGYIGRYLWSVEDIQRLHEFLTKGAVNADGSWRETRTPPWRAVQSMLDGEKQLYVPTADGGFVPLWREPNI